METEAASLKRKSEGEAELEEAPQKQQKRDNGWASVDDEAVACLHDVSYPEGYVVPPPSSSSSAAAEASEPAKKFPFPLDPFQSEAINCLEKAESVMVSAHTSAENCGGIVCDCNVSKKQAESDIHFTNQSTEQPKV
ncbi:hypothetical protein ACFX1S_044819 [Malus domestica]